MAISPVTDARLLGAGRVLIGAALVVWPEQASRQWLGDVSATGGGQVAVRALGIRDLILGGLALHTATNPVVGARYVQACVLADTVDAAATFAARGSLPKAGAWGTIALAGGSAVGGLVLARRMKASA